MYVAPTGTGDGSSWATAMGDLQAAIEQAGESYIQTGIKAEVRLMEGIYIPAGQPNGTTADTSIFDPDRDKYFSLRNGVRVTGGFAGTEMDAVPTGGATILSGDLGGGLYAYHVFYHPAYSGDIVRSVRMDTTAVLSNVTIQDGRADIAGQLRSSGRGGGIYSNEVMKVEHCVFRDNMAACAGGAICFEGSGADAGALITACTFTGNSTEWTGPRGPGIVDIVFGGAVIIHQNTTATISNSLFSDNSGQYAGALNVQPGATVTMNNCTFRNNVSINGYAGGASFLGALVSIDSCLFDNNIQRTDAGLVVDAGVMLGAGGIYVSRAEMEFVMTATTFTGNKAENGDGGALIFRFGQAAIDSCLFENNTASGNGGAAVLFYDQSNNWYNNYTTHIANSIFKNNAAEEGGAVYAVGRSNITSSALFGNTAQKGGAIFFSREFDEPQQLSNSTVVDNEAAGSGGGIYDDDAGSYAAGPSLIIVNTTLSGNNASVEGGGVYAASTVKLNGSLVAGNTSADEAGKEIRGTTDANSSYNIIGLDRWTLGEIFEDINVSGKAELKNNGGLTPTLMLAGCSPANKQIDRNVEYWCPAEDQRGVARPLAVLADIGAVQTGNPAPSYITQTAGLATEIVCAMTAITEREYTLSGSASSVTVSELPAGLTATLSNNIVFVSGTPTAGGTYTITTTGHTVPCGPVTISGTVTVLEVGGGAIDGSNTICLGGTSGTLTLSGHVGTVQRWESSTDGSSWTPVSNMAIAYSPGSPATTTYYRAVVKNGVCAETNSTPATVTVIPKPDAAGSISGTTSTCPGTSHTYSITPVTGATTYTWTVSAGAIIIAGQHTTTVTVSFPGTQNNATITVTPKNCSGDGVESNLGITINPTYAVQDSATICDNALPFVWEGETFTGADVRTKTLKRLRQRGDIYIEGESDLFGYYGRRYHLRRCLTLHLGRGDFYRC